MQTGEISPINAAMNRRFWELTRKPAKKVRPCLRCGKSFISMGYQNRMCGNCQSAITKQSSKMAFEVILDHELAKY